MANLSELKTTEEGRRLELRHPDTGEILKHEGKVMHLMIGSVDSKAFKKSQRRVIDERVMEQQKNRIKIQPAGVSEDGVTVSLADVTYGGWVFNDKEINVTPGKVALDLYEEFPWMRRQALSHLEDTGLFLGLSPTSSLKPSK